MLRSLTRVAVRRPRHVLVCWVIAVAALTMLGRGVSDELQPTQLLVGGTNSALWHDLRAGRFGGDGTVLLRGPAAQLDIQGRRLAARLAEQRGVLAISPWSGTAGAGALRPRADLALIAVDVGEEDRDNTELDRVSQVVDSTVRPPVHADVIGQALIGRALNDAIIDSSRRAELLSLPVLIIVLLLVFRSLIAAAVPLVVAGATVFSGTGVLALLARVFSLDAITLSLLSMMGLALGVDYSLLIVSRFREELARDASARRAASVAANTAGRTAIFAGVVLIAIMTVTLVLSPGSALLSAATGVIVVTCIAMLSAVLVTPAMLALLGRRIDFGRIGPRRGAARQDRAGRVVAGATRRPALACALVAVVLLVLGTPALGIETSPPDPKALPSGSPGFAELQAAGRAGIGPSVEIVVRAARGSVTRPDRLAALKGLEGRLKNLALSRAVAGPGALGGAAPATGGPRPGAMPDLAAGRHQLARLQSGLAGASHGIRRLRSGLQSAHAGAQRLSAGTGQARGGAEQLRRGSVSAQRGAEQLADGARTASAGVDELHTALGTARDGARRLAAGAGKAAAGAAAAARGARQLADGLGDDLVPGLRTLASRLRDGRSGVSDLRTAAQRAESELRTAFDTLKTMSVGRVDPGYAKSLTAVGTALAAVSGHDPSTGKPVAAGYNGLDDGLRTAADSADRAATAAGELADGAAKALSGARRLREGALALDRALRSLDRGAAALRAGLARITGGSADAASGVERLAGGSDALASGLQRAHGGAGRLVRGLDDLATGQAALARGLRDASVRTRPLGSGLGGAGDDVAALRGTLGAGSIGALGSLQEHSPGFFDSGYAGLAAIDGARPLDRAAASFLVATDQGGDTGRIIVTPDFGSNDPRGPGFLRHVRRMVAELPSSLGLVSAVGGPAASLSDYARETNHRIPWLVLGTALITYLLLVPILRSLVLPAIAVFLNLLTVAVAFGVLTLLFVGDDPPLGGTGALDLVSVAGIFAITFALSIDYQVFLLVRIREAYVSTQRNDRAISVGVEHTAHVVTGAAFIMVGVFLAFAMSDFTSLQQFGVGLTAAVAIDATLVRLMLLPALMKLFGLRTWWLPRRLDDRLPLLDVEGSDDAIDPLVLARRAADAWLGSRERDVDRLGHG